MLKSCIRSRRWRQQNQTHKPKERWWPTWQFFTWALDSFLDYFLGVILQAYRNLNDRLNLVQDKPVSATDLILTTLTQELKPLSRSELTALIPQYSDITIKRALSELKKSQRIKLIGKGRSSKYISSIVKLSATLMAYSYNWSRKLNQLWHNIRWTTIA